MVCTQWIWRDTKRKMKEEKRKKKMFILNANNSMECYRVHEKQRSLGHTFYFIFFISSFGWMNKKTHRLHIFLFGRDVLIRFCNAFRVRIVSSICSVVMLAFRNERNKKKKLNTVDIAPSRRKKKFIHFIWNGVNEARRKERVEFR